jgi:hypothetical protein
METKAIMSPDSHEGRLFRRSAARVLARADRPGSRERRGTSVATEARRVDDDLRSPTIAPGTDDAHEGASRAAARRVHARVSRRDGDRENVSVARRAPVIAARTRATVREPASLAEKFALAEARHVGGIKHGTVRNETTPLVRAASIVHLTQTRRPEYSLRVASSRLRPSPDDGPPRSDRRMDECSRHEERTGLHHNGGQG